MSQNRINRATDRPSGTVRFGGVRTPAGYCFELTGGCLCLDLANTVDNRRTSAPLELLVGYEDLLDWGRQSGAVTAREANRLSVRARRQKAKAAQALARVRSIREAVFAVFSAVARKARLSTESLTELNRAIALVLPARELVCRTGGFAWIWRAGAALDFDRIIWPALISAADLLTSTDLSRVRECAGEGCGWLFLDRSKSRTRRWCDMTVCGNRAKVRRHRSRRS